MFYKGMILTTEQIIIIVHNYLDIQYAIQKRHHITIPKCSMYEKHTVPTFTQETSLNVANIPQQIEHMMEIDGKLYHINHCNGHTVDGCEILHQLLTVGNYEQVFQYVFS